MKSLFKVIITLDLDNKRKSLKASFMSYSINIAKSVQKQIDKLPGNVIARIIPKIQQLEQNPHPVGSIKLKGYENPYRIRIGDYRLRYEVDDNKRLDKLLQCKVLYSIVSN